MINLGKQVDMSESRVCIACGESKSLTEYGRRRDGRCRSGWRPVGTCNVCKAAKQRFYVQHGPLTRGLNHRYNRPAGMRECRLCGEVKPLDEFRPRTTDGSVRRNECWECFRAAQSVRYHADRETHRDRMRRASFGMAPGEYARLNEAQGGLCRICGEPETVLGRSGEVRGLAVDHCHETNVVRGLLCMSCNQGLGKFRDDPKLLAAAIEYLNGHMLE